METLRYCGRISEIKLHSVPGNWNTNIIRYHSTYKYIRTSVGILEELRFYTEFVCNWLIGILWNRTKRIKKIHFNSIKFFSFFFYLCGETLGTAATTGLLYQPRLIGDGDCGEIGGMKVGRGNQSTRENLPQCHFVHHKFHMTRPGFEPEKPRWEASG
jgi:hypothetical protein